MALITVPGAGNDQNPVNLPGHDSSDLFGLFANSFQNLMNQTGSDENLTDRIGLDDEDSPLSIRGQDTISAAEGSAPTMLSVDGAMNFIGGAGSSQTAAGTNATIFGTAHTTYRYGGSDTAGTMTFRTTGDGDGTLKPENILFDASKSHKTLNAFAGLGDTVKGGTYANTITVHNTVNGGNGGADLYAGGSGSNNLFQFLNNKGGQYTIHDFQQTAGNKVGLKASDGQINDMLQHQHTVMGADGKASSVVDLPDGQGQITFQDVGHLNPKDFQKF